MPPPLRRLPTRDFRPCSPCTRWQGAIAEYHLPRRPSPAARTEDAGWACGGRWVRRTRTTRNRWRLVEARGRWDRVGSTRPPRPPQPTWRCVLPSSAITRARLVPDLCHACAMHVPYLCHTWSHLQRPDGVLIHRGRCEREPGHLGAVDVPEAQISISVRPAISCGLAEPAKERQV